MPAAKGGKALPKTKVYWEFITLSDLHPTTQAWTTFWFPRKMIAWPLSEEGPAGWGPNNKADWWPFFQQRHKTWNNYWVQGHMLNDNVHGPGEPKNLVPITGTLNTNMLGIVERFVKDEVKNGEVLYYEVEAHWEGATQLERFNISQADPSFIQAMGNEQISKIPAFNKAEKSAEKEKFPKRKVSKIDFFKHSPYGGATFRPTLEMLHPAAMRAVCGIAGIDQGGTLNWGEQFAPTRLSWKVAKSTNWLAATDWNANNHGFTALKQSLRSDDWNNNYPDK
jgi:hypothetical protein